MTVWTVATNLAWDVGMAWCYSVMLLLLGQRFGVTGHLLFRGVWFMFRELKPFYPPAAGIFITDVAMHKELTWFDYIGITMMVLSWWVAKNIDDDDDRWRRRRRRVMEKIRRVGHRLVPVPAR